MSGIQNRDPIQYTNHDQRLILVIMDLHIQKKLLVNLSVRDSHNPYLWLTVTSSGPCLTPLHIRCYTLRYRSPPPGPKTCGSIQQPAPGTANITALRPINHDSMIQREGNCIEVKLICVVKTLTSSFKVWNMTYNFLLTQ
jgi:hypothetical protein